MLIFHGQTTLICGFSDSLLILCWRSESLSFRWLNKGKKENLVNSNRNVVWENKLKLTKVIIYGNKVPRTLYKAKKVLTLKGNAD